MRSAAKLRIRSDAGLAQVLGVARGMVSHYRSGRNGFNGEVTLRVAEILELDPVELLVADRAQWERTTEERACWARYWEKTS